MSMPGNYVGKFLRKRIFREIEDDGESISMASIMAANSMASRVLRAAIKRIEKPNDIRSLFTALIQKADNGQHEIGLVGAILNEQYGVLCELADLCTRHPSEEFQRLFLKNLPIIFGLPVKTSAPAFSEDLFIQCLVSMKPITVLQTYLKQNLKVDSGNKNEMNEVTYIADQDLINPVCLAGCLFVQNLLKFSHVYPTRLVTSLCTQTSERLLAWAAHPMLSRVLEATLLSSIVPKERKTKLYTVFKGNLTILACDRYGSRVVEALWFATDSMENPSAIKEEMAIALSADSNRLHSHRFGHFIYFKLGLDQFSTNKDKWLNRFVGKSMTNKRKITNQQPNKFNKWQKKR